VAGPAPAAPSLPAAPAQALAAGAGLEEPVRLVACKLVAARADGLDLVAGDGRSARLSPGQVERVAVGLVERDPAGGTRGALLVDLVLRARPGQARVVVRIPGSAMALREIRPGLASAEAFASWMAELLAASGAVALPGPEAAQGRPFARFADAVSFEEACHRRRLTA